MPRNFGGRPRTKEEQKRYPLGLRTTKATREALEKVAVASGRSLCQEVELRLERSLRDDEVLASLLRIEVALAVPSINQPDFASVLNELH